jgi:hypothetical protein
MAACADCKGKGEIMYSHTTRSGERQPYGERCKRCSGTGLGKLTTTEMKAVGFRLVDYTKRLDLLAEWRVGTMVRHPVTGKIAHVDGEWFHGDVSLKTLDGESVSVPGESHPQRHDWQTVEPLFGSDVSGAVAELQELEGKVGGLESQARGIRTRIEEIRLRLSQDAKKPPSAETPEG